MKIPIWLASIIVGGGLTAGGWAVDHLSAKMDDMQKEIVVLQVDIAVVKARVTPESAHAHAAPKSTLSTPVLSSMDWLYP